MSTYLGRSGAGTRERLGLLELTANSNRTNGSCNGARVLGYRGSGGNGLFVPKTRVPSVAIQYTPFYIFAKKHLVSGTWDGTYDVSLYPGAVNQLLPTNIFDIINMAITSTQYVVLTCESDGYAVTSSTWGLQGSQPSPVVAQVNTPATEFYVVIGVIIYNSGPDTITIYQIIQANIIAAPLEWVRDSNPDAGPFELAYEIYYYWNITS